MNAPLTTPPALVGVPVLETERLVLRAPRPEDCEGVVAFHASERARFMGGHSGRDKAWRTFAVHIGHWVLRGYGNWAVTVKGSDDCVGVVGCWYPEGWPEREIGWSLFDGAEGKGIAREAALAARDHAYRALGWTTAVSYIDRGNARSIRLAERLGATLDARAASPGSGEQTLVFRHPGPEALA